MTTKEQQLTDEKETQIISEIVCLADEQDLNKIPVNLIIKTSYIKGFQEARKETLIEVEKILDNLPRDIPKYDYALGNREKIYINILPEHKERLIEVIKQQLKELGDK